MSAEGTEEAEPKELKITVGPIIDIRNRLVIIRLIVKTIVNRPVMLLAALRRYR